MVVLWQLKDHCIIFNSFMTHDRGPYLIETSPLICNQRTGFYMIGNSVMKYLIHATLFPFTTGEMGCSCTQIQFCEACENCIFQFLDFILSKLVCSHWTLSLKKFTISILLKELWRSASCKKVPGLCQCRLIKFVWKNISIHVSFDS